MSINAFFIKRAELKHDEAYIAAIFAPIGKVSDVVFIPKTSGNGMSYNGVIVNFESPLNMEDPVIANMINLMETSHDGTMRYYHTRTQYWFLQVHKLREDPEPFVVSSILGPRSSIQDPSVPSVRYPMRPMRPMRHVSPDEKQCNLQLDFQRFCQMELEAQVEKVLQLEDELEAQMAKVAQLEALLEKTKKNVTLLVTEQDDKDHELDDARMIVADLTSKNMELEQECLKYKRTVHSIFRFGVYGILLIIFWMFGFYGILIISICMLLYSYLF
jgi:hypothetical protein